MMGSSFVFRAVLGFVLIAAVMNRCCFRTIDIWNLGTVRDQSGAVTRAAQDSRGQDRIERTVRLHAAMDSRTGTRISRWP
jgi:hypothetical protein